MDDTTCPAPRPLAPHHFDVERITLDGVVEDVIRGGRHLFDRLPAALEGIDEIGVLGWGTQGEAQACNLRDALAGSDIRVTVGLRAGSPSRAAAERCGFTTADGTLGDLWEVAARADLVLLLVADAAQVAMAERLFGCLRPGATLGLSHGFLIGHLAAAGVPLPPDVNVVAACPKGMGKSVRQLFEQGATTDGAGINASVAVEQDVDGRATDIAVAWAIALGAPFVFATSMVAELRSDIFGERGVLLGAVHGVAESAYRRLREADTPAGEAFERSAATITGPIAATISRAGLRGLAAACTGTDRDRFNRAYAASYDPARRILEEIYDEVASGRELAGVVDAEHRLARWPMPPLERTAMWEVGASLRREGRVTDRLDPETAGVFAGTMVAQVDVLRDRGHSWSEIANESVIEAVDSLLPYMHARGIAYMVDSCSTTARLGARRWGPVFEAAYTREAFPAIDAAHDLDTTAPAFDHHPIHDVLDTLRDYRPSIDIAVA